FITPKSTASRHFRNAVLNLAREHPFARALVNSGRLSLPTAYTDSPLNTPDVDAFDGRMTPGAVALDAPVRDAAGRDGWWLSCLDGSFVLALFCGARAPAAATQAALRKLADGAVPLRIVLVGDGSAPLDAPAGCAVVYDHQGCLAQRYDARPGTCYLLRPDQHVAARRRAFDPAALAAALARALGQA